MTEHSTCPTAPPHSSPLAIDEAAEAYLAALTAQGVEYLFLYPGTDTVPIQEALAKFRA